MLFRISRRRKIMANGNFEHKLSKWVSIDGCQSKKGAWVDQKSLNIVLSNIVNRDPKVIKVYITSNIP